MKPKKIIILPTTNHALKSLSMIYGQGGARVTYANVSLNCLSNQCEYKDGTRFWKLYYSRSRLIRIFTRLFLGRLYTYSICKYLHSSKIDGLVVSNDCGFPQVYFITAARKLGLKTICHQVASGSVISDNSRRTHVRFFRRHLKNFFHSAINGLPKYERYGDLSDQLVLLGPGWAKDLGISKEFSVFSNPKYYHGMKIKKNCGYDGIIIFGVPLAEVPLMSTEIALKTYHEINNLSASFKSRGVKVLYKPHPQERLHQSQINFDLFEGDIDSAFSRFNICMSVSSSVCLEFRLSNRASYGLDFPFIPQALLKQTQGLFLGSYTQLLECDDLSEIMVDLPSSASEYYSSSSVALKDIIDAI